MLSVLYSQYSPDSITQSALRIAETNDAVQVYCIEDGMQQGQWFADNAGRFVFDLPAYLTAAIDSCDYLLNRTFLYDESLELNAELPFKVVQLESECIFRQLIDTKSKRSARTGLYGLCGDHLPLYLQWKNVRSLELAVATPRYDYAFGNLSPNIEGFSNTIYKSPYDLRSWQPNEPPERDWHTFVVERPAGIPVVATILNQTVELTASLDPVMEDSIRTASRTISRKFGSLFGEILYFVDDDTVTFAAFSHVTSNTLEPSAMDEILEKEITRLEAI